MIDWSQRTTAAQRADEAAKLEAKRTMEETREAVLEALELGRPIPADVRQRRATARAALARP